MSNNQQPVNYIEKEKAIIAKLAESKYELFDGDRDEALESDDYLIRFFYSGNYKNDLEGNAINPHAITMSCVPKTHKTMPIGYYMGRFSVKNTFPQFIEDPNGEYLAAFSRANAAITELQAFHETCFPIKRKGT